MLIRVNYYVIKYELQTTFSTEKARGPFGGEDSRLHNSHKFYSLRNTPGGDYYVGGYFWRSIKYSSCIVSKYS